jgi:LuxR family maltose regulon positive regulatory protein
VAEVPPGGAQLPVALDDLLLEAKLSVPHPPQEAVSRLGLIETARASGCRFVGVTAPAGYGKSTLLGQWAHIEDRRVGWLSLDRYDDDPRALLTLLASAYVRACDGDPGLVADVAGVGSSVLGRAAPRLASALRTSPDPFVLMLDDLHELRSPTCHDALGIVVSGIPEHSQVVTASRSEQPHLPSQRPSGGVLELLVHDLALDAAGAEQIFAAANLTVTPEIAAEVTERTEGWPAGLHLAAMIAIESTEGGLTIAGDDRFVADYLYRESLSQLPEADQRFLRCTAVLDQLSAPLCDAVLGSSGAQERLRHLERSSVFLLPLDRRRGWYRYHGLFREFLLGELRRVEPEMITSLHLRAADWFEANGSPTMAVEHLLNTSERDRCVRLVTALALPIYQAGQLSTVVRWLSALGDAAIEGHPPLAVIAGWTATLDGHPAEAERWARVIDSASFDAVPEDGSASFASARAMLRSFSCAVGPEQALADATFAVAEEPSWSPWRAQALAICGEAQLLIGDVDGAVSCFTEAAAVAPQSGDGDALVISESQLALLAMDAGSWVDAHHHLKLALAAIGEHRMEDYLTSVLAFAGAARLALHRGELDEMHRELTRAMRARPSCTTTVPAIAVRLRLLLAKTYAASADLATARHLLLEIGDILQVRPALGALVDEVAGFRDSLSSSSQQGLPGRPPLTAAELRLLPYLQTHLTIAEIAERLFVSRNTAGTHVKSIYRKLGVSSRNEAVLQATTIGLLGG